ncbi:MAG: hypothetical protein U0903_19090 [Planctomycetales bacterium]
MARYILIGLLIASQIVLGSAVPLYACVSADGSVAVEWVATACRCHTEAPTATCAHEDGAHEEDAHEHHCCTKHADEPLTVVETTASHDCSCTHVPLAGSPDNSGTPNLKTAAERVVRFCAEVSGALLGAPNVAAPLTAWRCSDSDHAASFAWGLLARSVLRC